MVVDVKLIEVLIVLPFIHFLIIDIITQNRKNVFILRKTAILLNELFNLLYLLILIFIF